MDKVKEIFDTKKEEITLYFDFIFKIVDKNAQLKLEGDFIPGRGRNEVVESIHSDIIDTLKANGFLLLYNLTESIIRLSLNAIKDRINNENRSFDELNTELKSLLTENLKKPHLLSVFSKNNNLSIGKNIIISCFDPQHLTNGNVDQETIKSLAKKIGFSNRTTAGKIHQGGVKLKYVRHKRNDLSHGNFSFIEVGRNVSVDEMIQIKTEVITFIDEIINNIDQYLNDNKYLKTHLSI